MQRHRTSSIESGPNIMITAMAYTIQKTASAIDRRLLLWGARTKACRKQNYRSLVPPFYLLRFGQLRPFPGNPPRHFESTESICACV
jgi:hypothetical protein